MSQDTLQQDTSPSAMRSTTIIDQWRVERPDLDPSAKHITGRIVRLASLFQQEFERTSSARSVSTA